MKTYKIKYAGKQSKILAEDILKIEAAINYSIIYLKSGTSIIVARTLKKYEKELQNVFFRVNRSTLVNLKFINLHSNGQVMLCNGQSFTISRRRINHFNILINHAV